MADKKISQLTAATTPLIGTEVLPIVQGTATVKVSNNDLRPKQIQSNATDGVLQVVGPAAASTRVMTTPNADFTVARTDAEQTFAGNQYFSGMINSTAITSYVFELAGSTTKTVTIAIPSGNGQFTVTVGGNQSGASGYAYASWLVAGNFQDAVTPEYNFTNIVTPVSNYRLSFSTITKNNGNFTFQAVSAGGGGVANICVTVIGAIHSGGLPIISAV